MKKVLNIDYKWPVKKSSVKTRAETWDIWGPGASTIVRAPFFLCILFNWDTFLKTGIIVLFF